MTYARITATLPERPGLLAAYRLDQVGTAESTVLSLWERGTADDHELVGDWSGAAAGAEPGAATILYFDGPLSDVAFAASERAARERIQPALTAVPGLIRQLALWQPRDRSVAVVMLAGTIDALEVAGRVVGSTALLPDEDPALLPGPDRAVAYHVAAVGHANAVGRAS